MNVVWLPIYYLFDETELEHELQEQGVDTDVLNDNPKHVGYLRTQWFHETTFDLLRVSCSYNSITYDNEPDAQAAWDAWEPPPPPPSEPPPE